MADTKITELAAYATVASTDVFPIVDVSDTSMAASGTNKKVALSMLPDIIDAVIGNTRGDVLYRGASAWAALAPGTAGQVLRTGGSGADPAWSAQLDRRVAPITAASDGATVTFDCSLSDWHSVTLGDNRTLALSGVSVGQQVTLVLKQDGTGSRTVTWFSGISWPGGSAPTLTTTANKSDVFTFKCTGSGAYLGFICGQNL